MSGPHKAMAQRDPHMLTVKGDPNFDPLRSDSLPCAIEEDESCRSVLSEGDPVAYCTSAGLAQRTQLHRGGIIHARIVGHSSLKARNGSEEENSDEVAPAGRAQW